VTWSRGEYQVPGGAEPGARVLVEVASDGVRLTGARLGGDLVGEPPATVERIEAALVGCGVGLGVRDLTGRLAAAIAPDALRALTAETIAVAVRRALGGATSWEDHTFEVVHEGPVSPWEHMALDQVLAESVGAGTRGPTLRLWEWDRASVVLGSFQSLRNEVDPDGARRHGVAVVRRVSGGGAMFVQPARTITFSLTVPTSLVVGMSFAASYEYLDDWVLGALAGLGVRARYVPLNDIASPNGKIAGAAQKRLASGAVLHHVTMAYDIDSNVMLEVLRTFRPPLADKGTKSAQKRVDPLRSQLDTPRHEVVEALEAHFRGRYRCVDGAVTDRERTEARRLVAERFATPQWTARIP
jgi:lipoate-protein ligase A